MLGAAVGLKMKGKVTVTSFPRNGPAFLFVELTAIRRTPLMGNLASHLSVTGLMCGHEVRYSPARKTND